MNVLISRWVWKHTSQLQESSSNQNFNVELHLVIELKDLFLFFKKDLKEAIIHIFLQFEVVTQNDKKFLLFFILMPYIYSVFKKEII